MKHRSNQLTPLGRRLLLYSGSVFLLGSAVAGGLSPDKRWTASPMHDVTLATPAAWQSAVTGQVRDISGKPLVGVSIFVKGNTSAVGSTSADGSFSVNADAGAILVFRSVGYAEQEVVASAQQDLTITLQSSAQDLDEVVVVGYGTQKKVNLTGAVSTIKGDDLVRRPVTNVGSMLQGQTPGLRVVQNSGEPGSEGLSVRVRGQGTFSGAGNGPLVLIDGVEGSLNDVNPNDVENISVLKDAASASIYGARAGNGVILVTTKMGKAGRVVVDYSGNASIHTPTKLFDLITNSAEYMELWNEAKINTLGPNATGLYPQETINLYRNATDRVQYPNTDWLDIMFNPAFVQQHNLSISGGSDNTQYNLSAGIVDQPGVLKGFDYKRYNVRLNLTSKVADWLSIGTNISAKQGDTQRPRGGAEDSFIATISQAPTYAPTLPDGRYTFKAYGFEYNNKNLLAIVDNEVFWKNRDYSVNLQGWMDVKLAKGFSWYTKAAIVGDFDSESDWRPLVPLYNFHTGELATDLDVGTKGLGKTRRENRYTNVFSYLKYENTFADNHNLGLQAGYSQEANRSEYLYGYRRDFFNNALQELDGGGLAVQNASGSAYEWALQSFFGRVTYDFKQRYLFEANLRYDGSSRLHPDRRWGAFPSVSAGWRVSEEPFVQKMNLTWLNNFKIRGSYGELGNQNINISVSGNGSYPYPYQDLLNYTGNYSFDNANLTTGAAQTALSNPLLRWEETKVVDIGADLTVLKGLEVTFDWYRRTTSSILRQSQITAVVGLSAPNVNSGTMRNEGIELGLRYSNAVNDGIFEGLSYSIGGNIDRFKNTVIRFGEREIGGWTIKEEGRPWDTYYMLEHIGIFQSAEEIANAPKQFSDNTLPGDLIYKDQNGDGVINNDDRVPVGGQYPSFEYAFTGNLNWKNFDLSFMFQGVEGRKLFVNNWGTIPFVQGAAPTTEWRDRWTEENPSTTMPRIYWGFDAPDKVKRPSTFFLQDASYLRLKNLTIGYSLPTTVTDRMGINRLRVFLSGDNLFTRTDYPGLDPERTGSGTFLNYPQNKIYAFGLNLQF
ncbi:TonB-dependent receptor [Sphingobacterium oryzagri]|uniref:TonB-dependent receptor n=1 Tax=Sphingobacterium oryzagri TaxID=3025669 RepID=A0ABY7WEY2_9SPHI|nr:TonB-dependent receptor [Sphingobacterium sp. KACC 22765]WDF67017.1 TonB-dependent receptor [Sphingobacterium sp. KACC 22765]